MADLKKIGAQLVVEGADQSAANWEKNVKAAEGYAAVLRQLVPLQAEQAIATVQQTQYTDLWKVALEGTRTEYEKFWADAGTIAQQGVVAQAQSAQEYTDLWKQALADKEGFFKDSSKATTAAEQQVVVDAAIQSQEYVALWEKALAEKDAAFAESLKNATQMTLPGFGPASGDALAIQDAYFAAQEQYTQASQRVSQFTEKEIAAKEKLWAANEKLLQTLKEQQGAQVALQRQSEQELASLTARAQGIVEAGIAFGASTNEMSASLQKLGFSAKEAREILANYGIESEKASQAQNRLSENSIRSSRAFFALTLASFGLMSITQQLEKAFGDDLPPAIERTTAAIQQIASFGSAGAFVGGVPGAIIGAIVGSVVALGTAAVQVDPQIQQLNQSLNNMSKKDEVVETLSRVAGVTKEVAAEWEEAARKSPAFAKELENIVKKAEPIPPILAAITAAGRQMGNIFEPLTKILGDAGDAMNKLLTMATAGYVGMFKFFETLANGGSRVEAMIASHQALSDVMLSVANASGEAGVSIDDQAMLTEKAEGILAETSKEAEKLADAQQRLADATENANFSMAQLAQRTANQYAAAQQQYTNAVSDAAEQRANAVFNAEQTLSNRVADLWQDLQNKVSGINQTLADKITDINLRAANEIADAQQQLQNRTADIQVELANRIGDIQRDLVTKISDIERDLANQLAELAHRRALDVAKANDKIQDAARDLARKLYEIERTRIEETERLNFDVHNRLMDARTDHDRDRIRRDQQFQQSQIDQNANNARQDALHDFASKVAQAQKEKQLAKDTYDYEVALAHQLAQQKMDEARRTADVQIQQAQRQADIQLQQAQRQADQQIAQAIRTAQQQLAVAQREHDQALLLAQRRYQEELAQAQRAYNQQIEAARRAEAQRNADAARSLEQRNAAIAQAAELERQQIQHTLEAAMRAYQRQIAEITNLRAAVMQLITAYLMLHGVIEQIAKIGAALTDKYFGSWIENMQKLGGLGMTPQTPSPSNQAPISPLIPKLFGNAPVTPASMNTSTSNNAMTFIINDATDPKRVAEVIRRELAGAAWR